ncbi:hypothetical protein NDU88_003772 [Pleurodeles waltl]|uniref:Uncharacterized protein n=1 Tax=Pleurodeles waltl TaxID=8319 RepID=A0AAV7PAZ9_PLEWA|nr:hypothetical protein NDU88_003772 [Pleurodeles waltl]
MSAFPGPVKLRDLWVQYAMLLPAKLRVTNNNTTLFFTSPHQRGEPNDVHIEWRPGGALSAHNNTDSTGDGWAQLAVRLGVF